jgi:hypothetical protein
MATDERVIGRPFRPGQSGNPRGRPKGSRHKLSEQFLAESREARSLPRMHRRPGRTGRAALGHHHNGTDGLSWSKS